MNRRVLCAVCLIVFVLCACTLFSLKIEDEMLIHVEVKYMHGINTWEKTITLPLTVLFEDEHGSHLYKIVEGTGWESGSRVEEVRKDDYTIDREKATVSLSVGTNYWIITTASRQPVPGELVEIVQAENTQITSDLLLFVYPEGVPEGYNSSNAFFVLEQSETSIYSFVENTTSPFFEHTQMGTHQSIAGAKWRIFSKNTVSDFWKQLPLLLLLVSLVLSVATLWVFSFAVCTLTCSPRRLFCFVGTVSIISLVAIYIIISFIDLPSAMLPSTNILHIQHYFGEYKVMLSALNTLPTALREFSAISDSVWQSCVLIVVINVALTCVAVICEWLLIRRDWLHF